jgi:hypothetical protein
MLAITANKKLKSKNFRLTKRTKLASLIVWIGIKSKRKKRRVQFFYYLENFRQRKFNLRTDEKKKTLKIKSKFTRGALINQLKQKRKRSYWFRRKKRYRYNSYAVLKNYCLSNFKKSYKSKLARRKHKKKNFVKRLRRWSWNKSLKLARRKLSCKKPKRKKKRHWLRKFIKKLPIKHKKKRKRYLRFWKKKKVKPIMHYLFKKFRWKRKWYKRKFLGKRNTLARNRRFKIRNVFKLQSIKRNRFRRIGHPNRNNLTPFTQSDLLSNLKRFKEFYNFEYILARGSKEINIEEMDAAGYIKEYSQTSLRWRFSERRTQKKYLPWLQNLIAKRNLYLFQNYNMLRRERPMHITKKNKTYKRFLMATHHRFQKIKLKPGKRGGNRYIWLKTNLVKSFLPHFNRLKTVNLGNIWSKFMRVKSKYLTRDMKFWNKLNLSFYSSSQLANWIPNTLWSNLAAKKGFISLATNYNFVPKWTRINNFPLLTNLYINKNSNQTVTKNHKNLTCNPFRVLHQSDILQISPYMKKFFWSFFNRKSKWNKKPIHSSFDRSSNYNAIVVNSFTRDFPLGFKNRNVKTNMKYLRTT